MLLPGLMICFWPLTSMSSGVLKENFLGASVFRSVFQITLPVLRSRATMNCWSLPSALKTRAFPTKIGEPPLPWTGRYFRLVLRQRTLPARSRQAVP